MKYIEASAQVMELVNCDVVTVSGTKDSLTAFIHDIVGNHDINESQLNKVVNTLHTKDYATLAKFFNENEKPSGLHNVEDIVKWIQSVNDRCSNGNATVYSSDVEDGFFDSEVDDRETDW